MWEKLKLAFWFSVPVAFVLGAILGATQAYGNPPNQTAIPPDLSITGAIIDFAIQKLTTVHGLGAIVGGLLFSWGATQFLKMRLPCRMPDRQRDFHTRLIAFVSGFLAAGSIWPMTFDWANHDPKYLYAVIVSGVLVSATVGLCSPFAYSTVMMWGHRKGWFFPARLSGSRHAETRRQAKSGEVSDDAG